MSRLRSVEEVPEPYTALFNSYPCFNNIQSTVFDDLLYSTASVVVTAPTGSGKTALFELALVKLLIDDGECHSSKAVYVAPVKALCNERYQDWSSRFGPLGVSCIEVTGDSLDDPDLRDFQIILTTPEKWDSITRKWRDKNSLVHRVKLLMVDEIHLIRDEKRGPVLESIVCRMKTMMRLHKNEGSVRFVGVSATIYNIDDLAAWLGNSQEPAIAHRFGNESRPVTLKRIVKGFPQGRGQNAFLYDIHLSYKLKSLLLNYSEGKPVLIFCSTRRGVAQTCKVLSENLSFQFPSEHKEELTRVSSQITDLKLRDLIFAGIGYHHAGMVAVDRKIVQDLFMQGFLPVLVATSTLAMGVNLPAHLVIIKSTHQFVSGRVEEYPESMVLQMVGRAGRPQFDTSATAVILTKPEMVSHYEKLLDCKEVLESSLHLHLAEYLNAEIVLLTIGDLSVAMEWLRCTFLYQRAIKNPKYYGLGSAVDSVYRIEKALETIVLREINALKRAELVEMSDNGMDISPTANGKLMSYFYVSFLTFKLFPSVQAMTTVNDLLCLLSDSSELAEVQLRVNERRTLNELNICKTQESIRFPMKGKISTRSMKVNCLIQACLGCIVIPEPSLFQEALRAVAVLERVGKCLTQYLKRKNWYVAYLSALTLTKCLHARLWENSLYVSRQLERIGPSLSSILVGCGKTSFQALGESSAQELERILKKGPPFGSVLLDKVRHLPRYTIDVKVERKALSLCVLSICISIENIVLVSRSNTAGPYHSLAVVVGDTDNRLLHTRNVPDSTLINNPLQFDVKLHSPLPQRVFISVISSQWVGLDVTHSVTVNPMVGASVSIDSHIAYKSDVLRVKNKTVKKKNVGETRPKFVELQKNAEPSELFVEPEDNDFEGPYTSRRIVLPSAIQECSTPPLSQTSYLRALEDCRNITFDLMPSSFEAAEEDYPTEGISEDPELVCESASSIQALPEPHPKTVESPKASCIDDEVNHVISQTADENIKNRHFEPISRCVGNDLPNETAHESFPGKGCATLKRNYIMPGHLLGDTGDSGLAPKNSPAEVIFKENTMNYPGNPTSFSLLRNDIPGTSIDDELVQFSEQHLLFEAGSLDDHATASETSQCREEPLVGHFGKERSKNISGNYQTNAGLMENSEYYHGTTKRATAETKIIEPYLRYLAGRSPQRNTLEGYHTMDVRNITDSLLTGSLSAESRLKSSHGDLGISMDLRKGLPTYPYKPYSGESYSIHQELMDKVYSYNNRFVDDLGRGSIYESNNSFNAFEAIPQEGSVNSIMETEILPSGNWKVSEILTPLADSVKTRKLQDLPIPPVETKECPDFDYEMSVNSSYKVDPLGSERLQNSSYCPKTSANFEYTGYATNNHHAENLQYTEIPSFGCNWKEETIPVAALQTGKAGPPALSPSYNLLSPCSTSRENIPAATSGYYNVYSSPYTSQSFGSETTSHFFEEKALVSSVYNELSSPLSCSKYSPNCMETLAFQGGKLSHEFDEIRSKRSGVLGVNQCTMMPPPYGNDSGFITDSVHSRTPIEMDLKPTSPEHQTPLILESDLSIEIPSNNNASVDGPSQEALACTAASRFATKDSASTYLKVDIGEEDKENCLPCTLSLKDMLKTARASKFLHKK